MSNYLLGFPNKKERDDFLVAIIVILFFAWIMNQFVGCGKDGNLIPNEDALANTSIINTDSTIDTDGDGIYDHLDKCPEVSGIRANRGCPADVTEEEDTNDKDSDGDGVVDYLDDCPDVAGSKNNDGCPVDQDGDGITDKMDKCPYLKGIAANAGCPEGYDIAKVAAVVDTDMDGIADKIDKCPTLAGIAANAGCPADSDGDGVYDKNDKCPQEKGAAANAGCPESKDSDGDGVTDKMDKCPRLAGIAANNGCPADGDGDGVYDKDDKCPNRKGLAANNGCPEIKVEEKEAEVLKTAIQAVEFQTNSASLKTKSKLILKEIIAILKKYPEYKIDIIGHTDNIGNDVGNLKLSKSRAESCAKYLIHKGINANRIRHSGQGETAPMATNDTSEGRAENRRVEFKLSY